jgi:hypothetical protein
VTKGRSRRRRGRTLYPSVGPRKGDAGSGVPSAWASGVLALDTFNLSISGAAQQFVTGGNQINSSNYDQMQNVQTPRAAQISA